MEYYLTDKATKGKWWDIPALVLSGILTAGGISAAVDNFLHPTDDPVIAVLATIVMLGIVSAPIWLYIRRRLRQADARKLAKVVADSGQSSLTMGAVKRRAGLSRSRVSKLMMKGMLQNLMLDEQRDTLRIHVPAEDPAPLPDTGNEEYNEILRQIRDLNDRIDDREVSRKIDRIELVTGEIFKLITHQPERAKEARRFISYYLPVTMKLLESYSLLEKQSAQGENIKASRAKIEEVLDTIIKAVERQEDRLFKSDALDVETDIKVLETLLTADGLTGPERGLRV